MREHEKWMESLQAKINQLKAAWQGFSQAFMSSDFLKGALDTLIKILEVLTKMIDTVGVIPTLLAGVGLFKLGKKGLGSLFGASQTEVDVLLKMAEAMGIVGVNSGKSAGLMNKAGGALKNMVANAGGATGALKGVGSSLLGLAKAHPVALAATVGVTLLAGAYLKAKKDAKELAEEVDKLTANYQEQHGSLVQGKAAFDTQATRYAQLSKGVDSLGRNVSLTSGEYEEYLNITNSIADQVPSLVSGYDEHGNAILNCAGNVDTLTAAYEGLIKAQNDEILVNMKDVEEDFDNAAKSYRQSNSSNTRLTSGSVDVLEKMLNESFSIAEVGEYLSKFTDGTKDQIKNAIENSGMKVLDDNGKEIDLGKLYSNADLNEYVSQAIKQHPDAIRAIINDFNSELETEAAGMKSGAEAVLSNAFNISDSKYADMNDTLQTIARQIVSGFDFDFYSELKGNGQSVEEYIHGMLDEFNKLGEAEVADIEAIFDLQTKFNNGEVSYGEYISGIKDAEEVINGLDLDDEVKNQIKLALNTEEITNEYEALQARLEKITKASGKKGKKIEEFLGGLSAEELSVAVDIIPEIDEGATLKEIQSAINREMAIRGLVFDLNIEAETAGIDAVNTALAETVSASGLSSESIEALKGRYAALEEEGYNLSSMFEETSNGIHLNRAAFSELEQAYAKKKLSDVKADLTTLKTEYDNLTKEIDSCTDASERASLYSQRDAILQQINDCATLASQYKGLASAYNAWLSAEEAGQERDMYENIIEGFENVGDEISRGWIDDGSIKFLELLTGKTDLASKSGKELNDIYQDLDNTIKNTTYSVSDFFTVDDDGNSTNAGVYNFLDAVHQLEKTDKFKGIEEIEKLVKKDANGNIISFDFGLVAEKDEKGNIIKNGDQVIAEALGISEELVQIMLRAADDAGFVVNLEGAYTQLADLKTEAEAARDSLKELKESGLKELEGVNVDFNLEAEGDALVKEQAKAVKLLDKFRNTDGTINLDMKGAQDALDVAEYLTIKIDDLTEPKYMQIDASTVDEDLQEPLEKMQEFERLSKTSHLAALEGDKELLKETEDSIAEITNYLGDLDKETKIELGIEGLTPEEIADKLEKGEIEIPADLSVDLEMSDDLKDMRLMMMNQLGLASDNEVKLKVGYDIDESTVDSLTDEEKEVVVKYVAENEEEFNSLTDEEKEVVVDIVTDDSAIEALEEHGVEIEAFAKIFGVEEVDDLKEKLDTLGDEQIQILATVLGQIDVEKLKTTINNLDDKTVEAIAKALGKGDVEGLKTTINGLDDKTVQAIAEALGYSDVDELNTAIDGMDGKTVQAIAEALGITDVESLKSAIDRLDPKTVEAAASVSGKSDVDNLKSSIDNLKGKNVTIWASIKKKASNLWDKLTGTGGVDGTAHVSGTAYAKGTASSLSPIKSGRAFKQGDWGTKGSGIALGGEEDPELLVRNGRWHLIGEKGAEFFGYKKGDIIFNASQTREIFEKGKITHGNGRGKALVSGTAFSSGTGGIGKVGGKAVEVKADTVNVTSKSTTTKDKSSKTSSKKSSTKKSTTKKSSTKKSSSSDDFEETFDWIEIKISRLERAIDRLDQRASRTWEDWGYRNGKLSEEITKINSEITTLTNASNKYKAAANAVPLAEKWKKKVRNGTINFSTIKNEDLAEKIKSYQEYWEKHLDAEDKLLESRNNKMSKYIELFENVMTKYDGILAETDHRKSMYDEFINRQEVSGHIVSTKYYEKLKDLEQENIDDLQAKRNELIQKRADWVAAGGVVGSEDWDAMTQDINDTTLAIEEGKTAIVEYGNAIRDIEWETFDLIQERISNITDEAEFLIDLLSSKDLFDDNGKLTDEGRATMGLHAQNYNVHMEQADRYGAEAERLNTEIAKDPYNKDLIARRDEMLQLQRESILAAQDEKEALRDLVEEGIEIELDTLQERIDKYEESLDAAKDLYNYNNKVKKQTKEIANLEKQLAAYEGDNSEEAKAKAQQLRVELAESREALEEMEYEKYISDQKELLDDLYTEYEEILNTRLDNIDALLSDVITEVNDSSSQIAKTIEAVAKAAGYNISNEMDTIWNNKDKDKDVVSTYSSGTADGDTTTNDVVEGVEKGVQNAIEASNQEASANITQENTTNQQNTTYTAPAEPAKPAAPAKPAEKETVKKGNGVKAKSYPYGKASATSGNIGYGSKGKAVKAIQYALNKLGYGNSGTKKVDGIFGSGTKSAVQKFQKKMGISADGIVGKNTRKKFKAKGYASGAKSIEEAMAAWTQEAGREFIVRPSDGAILTPLAKDDMVLNAAASNNIWDMANNPTDFIKNNLDLGVGGAPNNVNVQSNLTQNLDKVVFSFPNVQNYNEMLSAMQKDKSFEKLIMAMTIDRVAGGSSLAKGKAIR